MEKKSEIATTSSSSLPILQNGKYVLTKENFDSVFGLEKRRGKWSKEELAKSLDQENFDDNLRRRDDFFTDVLGDSYFKGATNGGSSSSSGSSKKVPITSLSNTEQQAIWKYVVRISTVVDGMEYLDESFSGIILRSIKGFSYVLMNLHSFIDNGKPMNGFPPGYEKDFKELHKDLKGSGPKRKRKVKEEEEDPVKIRIEKLEKINDKYKILYEGVLTKEMIKYASGLYDTLIIYAKFGEKEEDEAPISHGLIPTQHVHLFGFAKLFGHTYYCVGGEVTSVDTRTFYVNSSSISGMSGGAVICDGTSIIGYIGGRLTSKDDSFGAYCFRIDLINEAFLSKEFPSKKEEEEKVEDDLPPFDPDTADDKKMEEVD